jgi:hypothetical protein
MQKVWPLTKIESNEGISHGVWLASPVIEYGRLVHHLAISGFFFFFLTCPHKRGEGGIQTSGVRFMRRGPQPIEQ